MKKEFIFRGKKLEELTKLNLGEFASLLNARQRRSLKRGLTDQQKILLEKFKKDDKNIKTHCRDMIILPDMVNKTVSIHNGKEFVRLDIMPDMLGHYLGEFMMTRRKVSHHAPGIGATRSSASLSVK
ncbi:30S ribosomal protein S19 [Candidatus Woesearchaeota archaeon]|nr:30S ribosomal protein S19 [Candidatus Woesearchaeota archaeon]|tara:strand:+ start:12104 stop:12484 length:381 start_codon:yes stop_codon:yes gene_type:complete